MRGRKRQRKKADQKRPPMLLAIRLLARPRYAIQPMPSESLFVGNREIGRVRSFEW